MDYLLFPFDFLGRVYNINTTPFTKEKLKIGKKYAKKCHCVIGTLLRDAEDSYSYGVELIKTFSKIFKTVDLIILENDSEDRTRKLWTKYSEKCPENVKIFLSSPDKKDKDLKYKTVSHETTDIRMRKMVKLRNILLKNIKAKSRKVDYETYVFITDLDIKGHLGKEGIYDTFYRFKRTLVSDAKSVQKSDTKKQNKKSQKLDAIGCNGLTWKCFYFDDYAYQNRISRVYSAVDVPVNKGLYPVISTFSGGVFYKYDSLAKLKYKFKKNGNRIICEHVTINEKIKIAINTNMIYNISSH